ncbi:MAG: bifunctional phosphopantothenoylcysteine decarboxylase/phosphopantothenate--cysteine ligase CoaBC [Pseudomonadota bacterium]
MYTKKILLIITGGIAAYKSLELIRQLKKKGAEVRVVLTKSATQFITPLTVSTLAETECFTELFNLKDETEIGHIQLSRHADLIVVAPASANCLAKMAHGLADDLASTVLLATDKDVIVAPAMNVRMWNHVATQRNLASLMQDGICFVGPEEGDMACGEYGPGRMAEVDDIVAAIERRLAVSQDAPLMGRRILITSGPTQEPIDPVRYITNRSSGKQGYAIAAAARELGAEVILVSGPTQLPPPQGVQTVYVETAKDMLQACKTNLPVDVAVCAAAVSDWGVSEIASQKIKKNKSSKNPPLLELVETPDILKTLSKISSNRPSLVVGFAAETENIVPNALKKRQDKGCNWIVANNVSEGTDTFGGDNNQVCLITPQGVEEWEKMSKQEVATKLMLQAADFLEKN